MNDPYYEEWNERIHKELEEFFSKIEDVLYDYASAHNLFIEKYYHYIPGWEFLFRHPREGKCYIEVLKHNENSLTITGAMWIDASESNLAYDKHTDKIHCTLEKTEIKRKLENMLNIILSWNKDDLVKYQSKPINESKEEIAKEMQKYPLPTI